MNESSSTSPPRQVLAVFDFDGTITYRDSLIPFLIFIVGKQSFWHGIIKLSPMLAKYALKLIPNWQAKQRLLSYFLSGREQNELAKSIEQFLAEKMSTLVRPEAIERLRWHQRQGHTTILVSASPELYLTPWARSVGFDDILGTRLEICNGILTGKMSGKNCYGPEKVQRLRTLIPKLNEHYIYAYGDSKGDQQLLSIASSPHYRSFPKPE